MIATYVEIRQNDTAPSLLVVLKGGDGSIQDLTGATATFTMKRRGYTETVVNAQPCVIPAPATSGQVRYDWQIGDTAKLGEFNAVFRVTLANTKQMSFPNNDEKEFVVHVIPPV